MIGQNPIMIDTAECEEIYSPECSCPQTDSNEYVRISLVVDGKGIIKVFGEANECSKGDMYILGSSVPYGYFAKSETERPTVKTLIFDPSRFFEGDMANPRSNRFCAGIFRDNLPVSYAYLNSRAAETITYQLEQIADELSDRKLEWELAVGSHLTMLLITASRYIDQADTARYEHPEEWQTVLSVIKLINERCGSDDMTLESIAASLYVSKSRLSRIFKDATGVAFADYVRNTRMTLACKLLRTTNLTNEEIVNKCGLRDVPSFYNLFKTYMGTTPYQYRMTQYKKGDTQMSIYLEISEQLQKGKAKMVKELVQNAVDSGMPVAQILNEGLLSGMNIIGEKFKNNEVYVPEVLIAARAMNAGMEILQPLLVESGVNSVGRVCIGTVQGDLHDIGKNLVKMMMEGKGLEVIDLGTDVAPEVFVNTAIEQDCQIICCSALLTTTMDVMAEVVKCAEKAGIRDKVKILIGGAPITEEFCNLIGADKYTPDAASAADAAVEFLSQGE